MPTWVTVTFLPSHGLEPLLVITAPGLIVTLCLRLLLALLFVPQHRWVLWVRCGGLLVTAP